MSWTNWPNGPSRTDDGVTYHYITAWEFLAQAWSAINQRHAVLSFPGNLYSFPPPNKIWDSGTITSVTSNASAGTITAGMSGVNWTPGTGFSSPKWLNYKNPACREAHVPANYDLIIAPTPGTDTIDPRHTVRGHITGVTFDSNTSTGTLTISRGNGPALFPPDAVTANYIPSIASLVGQNWYIVKQNGYFSSERLPDRPDDQQLWVGSGTGGSSNASGTMYSIVTDTAANWPTDLWAEDEVLFWGDDAALHRETIIHNTATTLEFAARSYNASGAYIIVAAGAVGQPGRSITPAFQWYTGLGDSNKTHMADDSIGSWPLPAQFAQWSTGDNCKGKCEVSDHQAFDIDAVIDVDDDCAGQDAGNLIAWKYFKSLRSIQNDIIGICPNFLPYTNYSGQPVINLFTPATLFQTLGINTFACGYTFVDGSHLTVSGAPAGLEYPRPVFYSLLNADGTYTAGTGTLESATNLSGGAFSNTAPLPTQVVIALGFSRYRPRHVRYFYPKSGFIPTIDTGTTYDPPVVDFDGSGNTIDYTGQWVRRPGSTTYKSRGPTGVPGDGPTAFVDGELATHVGDNAPDTCITTDGSTPIPDSSGAGLLAAVPYYDHFYRGTYGPALEQRRRISVKGSATSGAAHSLTDSLKNWWMDGINGSFTQTAAGTITAATPYSAGPPIVHGSGTAAITVPATATSCTYTVSNSSTGVVLAGSSAVTGGAASVTLANDGFTTAMIGDSITMTFQGVLHTESGTATSGTTTSLTDSTHSTVGATNPAARWWSAGRFIGFSDPSAYTDFILTVSRTVSGVTTTWKMPITSTSSGAGGVTINFAAVAGLAVAAGDSWSITESAYEINKWEGRGLNLAFNSSAYTTTITHSDDITLFFGQVYNASDGSPATVTIGPGWSYLIDDRRFGGVWKWNAANGIWTIPSGMDSVRLGVPTAEPFQADQTMNLPTIVKDYGNIMVDDIMCVEVFTEMQAAINALIATKADGVWVAGHTETNEDYQVNILGDTGDERNYIFDTPDDAPASYNYSKGSYDLSIYNQLTGGVDEISGDPWPGPNQGNWDTIAHPQKSYTSLYGERCFGDGHGGGEMQSAGTSESGYAKGTNISTVFSSTMDAYCFGYIDAANEDPADFTVDDAEHITEFDATTNPVLWRLFEKVSSDSGSDATRVSATKLGDLTTNIPAIERLAAAPGESHRKDVNHGWYVPDPVLILKWDFTYA
jgi:hypothetical protein